MNLHFDLKVKGRTIKLNINWIENFLWASDLKLKRRKLWVWMETRKRLLTKWLLSKLTVTYFIPRREKREGGETHSVGMKKLRLNSIVFYSISFCGFFLFSFFQSIFWYSPNNMIQLGRLKSMSFLPHSLYHQLNWAILKPVLQNYHWCRNNWRNKTRLEFINYDL